MMSSFPSARSGLRLPDPESACLSLSQWLVSASSTLSFGKAARSSRFPLSVSITAWLGIRAPSSCAERHHSARSSLKSRHIMSYGIARHCPPTLLYCTPALLLYARPSHDVIRHHSALSSRSSVLYARPFRPSTARPPASRALALRAHMCLLLSARHFGHLTRGTTRFSCLSFRSELPHGASSVCSVDPRRTSASTLDVPATADFSIFAYTCYAMLRATM